MQAKASTIGHKVEKEQRYRVPLPQGTTIREKGVAFLLMETAVWLPPTNFKIL